MPQCAICSWSLNASRYTIIAATASNRGNDSSMQPLRIAPMLADTTSPFGTSHGISSADRRWLSGRDRRFGHIWKPHAECAKAAGELAPLAVQHGIVPRALHDLSLRVEACSELVRVLRESELVLVATHDERGRQVLG